MGEKKLRLRMPRSISIAIFISFEVVIAAPVTLDSADGQTNLTTNQTTIPATTTAEEEASRSIRGAITETGEFIGNVTEKVATSESAGTIVNETSEVLGNAAVKTQRFFNPDMR
jgi:hypothetical protein